MWIVLSSMQRPRDVTGKVCNQAPDSFLEADEYVTEYSLTQEHMLCVLLI